MSARDTNLVVDPGGGRRYAMGSMSALFLADEAETDAEYSISEWWLDPHTGGPGAHSHEAHDDIFYVLDGAMTFLVGDNWRVVEKGGFVRVGRGTTHDFRNDGDVRAGMLNIYIPGGFEREMPAIVKWFAENG